MARPFYSVEHYASRLGRVLEYIDFNLAIPLRLPMLAEQASFSPYHFHRIFCEWQGETPQAYIRRCRLERSAALLHYGKGTPVMEIAPQCGFTSVEAFDRAFRTYFGMTPTQWRSGGFAEWRMRATPSLSLPPDLSNDLVQIKRFPALQTVYYRKLGSYQDDEAALWTRLAALVEPFGLSGQTCFGVGLDDPAVTPAARCRFDVCIELPASITIPVHTPVKLIQGGPHAVLPYDGRAGATEGHWLWLLQIWLPQSGYKVSQHSCFERYPGGIPTTGLVHSELCLPLVR
jgi:AraC family transcriptional regulator